MSVPSPFFPGIILFGNPSTTQGNSWVLKRATVEKSGELTPRRLFQAKCQVVANQRLVVRPNFLGRAAQRKKRSAELSLLVALNMVQFLESNEVVDPVSVMNFEVIRGRPAVSNGRVPSFGTKWSRRLVTFRSSVHGSGVAMGIQARCSPELLVIARCFCLGVFGGNK